MDSFLSNFRVVGDSTVGKSAITQSFASDGTQFAKAYNMVGGCQISAEWTINQPCYSPLLQTTWVDICVKAIQIPDTDVTVVRNLMIGWRSLI